MKAVPKNPQALTTSESNMISKVSKFFDSYSGIISVTSFASSVVGAYITYQQNKEIIKQLREINRKLDIVINQLAALSAKLDQVQYKNMWDKLFSYLTEVYNNQTILDANDDVSKILSDKLRTDLSIHATYFLQLNPYFAFDFIGTVYGELLRLYEISNVNNENLKKYYRAWFSECLSVKYHTPQKVLVEQRKMVKEMEKTYLAGTYRETRYYGTITETITYKVTGKINTGFKVEKNVSRSYEHPDHMDDRGHGRLKFLEMVDEIKNDPFSLAQELYTKRIKLIRKLEEGTNRIKKYINA